MIEKSIIRSPLITIITVVYNGEKSLEETILSIITQTYSRKEFIIIDGASQDATLDIIRKYSKKIDLSISEPDKGIYDAMNKGIDMATGDYILFMNSGDRFYNNSTLASIFQPDGNNEDIIFGDTFLSDCGSFTLIKSRNISNIKRGLPFCHQSVFVRSAILKERKFDLNYRVASDFDFFLSVYLKGIYSFKRIDLPVSVYDNNGVSTSLLTIKEYSAILKKYFPYSYISHYNKLRVIYFSLTSYIKKILPYELVQKIVLLKKRIFSKKESRSVVEEKDNLT